VSTAAFSPDGSTLVTGSADRTQVLWDVRGPERFVSVLTAGLTGQTSTLWAAGSGILVGSVGGALQFVDPGTGAVRGPSGDNPHAGAAFIYTARSGWGSDRVVVADSDGLTAIWSLGRRDVVAVVDLPKPDGTHTPGVWVSPDGATAATIRDGEGIRLVGVEDGSSLRTLPALPAMPSGSAPLLFEEVQGWTADGSGILVSRRFAGTDPVADLLVVDVASGAVRVQAPLTSTAIEAVADPSGSAIAVGLESGQVQFLDARTGAQLAPPSAAEMGYVANVSAAPGGGWFSASGGPPEVTVWDARSFRQSGTPLPLDLQSRDARARFAADGRLVVASEGTLRAFTVDPVAWLERACREAGRVLTEAEFAEFLPGRPYDPACAD
jgi:WD40 repeat protein